MRHRRRGAAVLSAVAVLLGTSTGAAVAAPASGPQRTLRLELVTAGDAGAPVVTIPAGRSLDAASRRAVARSLQPGARTAAAARAEAVAAGLTVTSSTSWQLTVLGPADIEDRLFGTDADALSVPAAWTADVAAVIDPAAGQGFWRSSEQPTEVPTRTQSVAALSQAYGNGEPSTTVPTITSQTPIIASVQFSGWDDTDLSAAAPSIYGVPYDPVASGQFTEVGVNRSTDWIPPGDDPTTDPGDGAGYREVALDQETLLAAAPELRQRAYIADNSSGGLIPALQAVQSDIASGMPIIALTTSWGSCERYATDDILSAEDSLLHQLTALGVSVFAASGDSGAQDCGRLSHPVGVDYPASDPNVIAVGGTSHPNGAAPPAPDTAWAEIGAGSGGGESSIFEQPSWQAAAAPLTASRAVPDVAVDADEHTGVAVLATDPGSGSTGVSTIGGTSLAAPLMAGMTAAMAARIFSGTGNVGLGDLHPLIYANAPADVVDVVALEPTAPPDSPTELPSAGYDEVTGLGTPRMDVLTALLTPATPATAPSTVVFAPTPMLSLPTVKVTSWSRPDPRERDAVVTWQTSDGTAVLQGFTITVTQGSKTVTTKTVPAAARSATLLLSPGTYAAKITAVTSAGTASATGKNSVTMPSDAATTSGWTKWKRAKDSKAFDGTLTVSSTAGRALTFTANGSVFGILLRGSKDGGEATLLLDGKKLKTLDLFRRSTTELMSTTVKASRVGKHTLSVVVLGRHTHGSSGNTVAVDAFTSA